MVFTTQYRDSLRRELIEMAKDDTRIKGAAITGSASVGLEDRWSDIDLFFGIDEQMLNRALDDWTDLMYNQYGAVHHLDIVSGKTIYRVFLLRNTLQVDLAFSPTSEFGARGATLNFYSAMLWKLLTKLHHLQRSILLAMDGSMHFMRGHVYSENSGGEQNIWLVVSVIPYYRWHALGISFHWHTLVE